MTPTLSQLHEYRTATDAPLFSGVPGDVAVICVSAFAICTVAAIIPAWFAARMDPVKALRYE